MIHPDALQAEIREAKQNARLKVLTWVAAGAIIALLVASLVYTLQAASEARRAANAATAQSKTNEQILERILASEQTSRMILTGIQDAGEEEKARFQALLDTVYGPGVVTLGKPANARPRGTEERRMTSRPESQPRQEPRTQSKPKPRPGPRPVSPPPVAPPVTPPTSAPEPPTTPPSTPPSLLPFPIPTCTSVVCAQ